MRQIKFFFLAMLASTLLLVSCENQGIIKHKTKKDKLQMTDVKTEMIGEDVTVHFVRIGGMSYAVFCNKKTGGIDARNITLDKERYKDLN